MNILIIYLLPFPIILVIFTVISPCTITIIVRSVPVLFLAVAGYGGCWQVIHIWRNKIIGDPFWNISCWIIGWTYGITISIVITVPIDMYLLAELVTSYIWPGRRPSTRAITISAADNLKINLLQIIVSWLLNLHRLCLHEWSMVLRLLLYRSGLL